MQRHERLETEFAELDVHISVAGSAPRVDRSLLLVHGLPRAAGMGRTAAGMLPELAELLANESGWLVASCTLAGVGSSTGTFSATQWRRDLAAVVDRVDAEGHALSLCGFGLGGNLSLRHAADDPRVRGVVTFATSADLVAWCGKPEHLHRDLLRAGVVDKTVPLQAPDALVADVLTLDPLGSIAAIPPRRLLIGHGADDHEVPVANARALFAAADEHAELRIIQGAGHWLRADPRMVATLLGWLDRHR